MQMINGFIPPKTCFSRDYGYVNIMPEKITDVVQRLNSSNTLLQ